jgi:hypothetical protein
LAAARKRQEAAYVAEGVLSGRGRSGPRLQAIDFGGRLGPPGLNSWTEARRVGLRGACAKICAPLNGEAGKAAKAAQAAAHL